MHTLAFDGGMGASGDMLLGALLSAGADREVLAAVEDTLPIVYEIERVTKNGIAATSVDVVPATGRDGGSDGGNGGDRGGQNHGGQDQDHEPDRDHEPDHDHEPGHDHDHEPGHDHDHEPGHDHHAGGEHETAEGVGPLRTYPEVLEIVESMGLPAAVESNATAVFTLLGEAEAAVHDTDLTETHFHEVGADDAVADVVGTCLLVADLDVDRVVTTPLSTGGGRVEMSHGRYPVPTPAVVELAGQADWELTGGPVEAELLTPTGAALLAHFAEGVTTLPAMTVRTSGYGAGRRDFPAHPNVLRALVGETRGPFTREDVTVLETNLDDATPEVLGGLQETLAAAGARDVSILPTTMKKSRPGHLVRVVVDPADAGSVARRLAEETGTLGIRETGGTHRWIAGRRTATATLSIDGTRHEVGVKIGTDADGNPFDVSAEYDEAAAVADRTDRPIRDVMARAETAVRTGGGLSPVLVHVLEADRWEAVGDREYYAPPRLESDGYVPAAPPEQAARIARAEFPDDADLRVLVVDRDAVEAEIKYEETLAGAFPHIYGKLNVTAVSDVLEIPREDGDFVLPEPLRSEA